ncbi:MAG: patatin-like phospholipase family protein [Burkholderiaceae bacterium]
MKRRQILVWGGAASLAGCSFGPNRNQDGPDAPRILPLGRPVRTAWVLSSGGPRGFTHVGVLKALDALGLVPDLIVGASVGAMLGCLCASGLRASAIEALALGVQPLQMARLAIGQSESLSGAPIAELVRSAVLVPELEQMPVAMACVAMRRSDQVSVAFTAGDPGLAVQASAAIEGRFTPVRIRGQEYVDPDWSTPLPVRIARTLGATRVLAVDATAHLDTAPPGAERYRAMDLQKKALVDADAMFADLVLKPDFGYWVNLSQEFRERAIAAGYQATMAQAAALRQLHGV